MTTPTDSERIGTPREVTYAILRLLTDYPARIGATRLVAAIGGKPQRPWNTPTPPDLSSYAAGVGWPEEKLAAAVATLVAHEWIESTNNFRPTLQLTAAGHEYRAIMEAEDREAEAASRQLQIDAVQL